MMWLVVALLVSGLQDNVDFSAAQGLYRDLEYEQAMLTFERLAVTPGLTLEERAEVLLWAALCSEGLGDSEGADRWMKEAIARHGKAVFPVKAPPRISERLEKVRRDLTEGQTNGAQGAVEPSAPASALTQPVTPTDPLPTTLGAGAVVALAGTGALALFAADAFSKSQDTALFVDERSAHHGSYLGALTGAVALGVVGAGLGTAAGFLVLTRSEP